MKYIFVWTAATSDPSKAPVIPLVVENFPGWKTQYKVPVKGITAEDNKSGIFFYGFGNCPFTPYTAEEFKKAKSKEEVINFYVKVIRADCSFFAVPHIMKLIDTGRLGIKDKTFELKAEADKLLLVAHFFSS